MRTTGVEFLKRVFDLITLLGRETTAQPLRHIALKGGLPKPSAHRLLNMLKKLDYVDTDESGHYFLTTQIHELVPANRNETLKSLALPVMGDIYAQLNETTNLAYLDGHRIQYVHIMESTQPLRWSPLPVTHEEVLTTALGRSIFAYLPKETRTSMLPMLLERVRKLGDYDTGKVEAMTTTIRRQKIALDLEENMKGAVCFGIPLFKNQHPVGAISVTVPTPRLDNQFRRKVMEVMKGVKNHFDET